ncbi:MAG: GAF domain-containing protein [Thiothrix sp.]|nr:GAF domain-containing protein [Thiothrix sp.]HPQ96256.1 histidine kinase [Thiolinea sp.]
MENATGTRSIDGNDDLSIPASWATNRSDIGQQPVKRGPFFLPWQVLLTLVLLFVVFVGIGMLFYWLPGTNPTYPWLPPLMSTLWLMAGLGFSGLLFWVWREFVSFGGDLAFWAARLRKGDLSARMPVAPNCCLSVRTRERINAITHDYQALARMQRHRMSRQEQYLEQKKHHLNVLYDVASAINRADSLDDMLQRLLKTLKAVVGAEAVAIRLLDREGRLRLVASSGLDEAIVALEEFLPSSDCLCGRAAQEACIQTRQDMRQCGLILQHTFFSEDSSIGMLAIPIQYRDKVLGVYNLFVPRTQCESLKEEYELLTSLGQHLGMAVEKAGVEEEAHNLSIMQERTRMAHELHDSLAQTLASLRFKVRLLDDSLNRGDEAAIWQEVEALESTIDEAYAELRSLITHFRAPMDGRGVLRAVEALAVRFRKETGMEVFFYHNWSLNDLDPEVAREVVRIVQEALNNVRKHSQASTVRILMYSSEEGRCSILVEDDGVGLPGEPPRPDPVTGEHLGLGIMHERAAKIGGELQFDSDPDEGGTLVQLSFHVAPARKLSELIGKTEASGQFPESD